MMRLRRSTTETKELNQRLTDTLKSIEEMTGRLLDVAEDFQEAVKEFRDDGTI
jgi:hypothetical protein